MNAIASLSSVHVFRIEQTEKITTRKSKLMKIDGKTIHLSHPEKSLFPKDEITKGDLVSYYQRISEFILPYLQDRPISMQRFPDGIGDPGFYQKEAPDYFPDWIKRVDIKLVEEGDAQPQVICDSAASLAYLANQACISIHTWLSRTPVLERPDQMIFDLDPPGEDFEDVRFAAKALKEILDEFELAPFLKTTGARGLHVVIPLDGSLDFQTVREFAHDLGELLASRYPERLTVETRKEQRGGRLFVDYLRNVYAQTAVAPYSVRAKPGAPVATPIDWAELDRPELDSQSYNMKNIFRRLGQKGDVWRKMQWQAKSLQGPMEKLERMLEVGQE